MTGVEDGVVGGPDACAQLVLAQIVPDVFHWVEFGGIGRQGQQCDVVGDHQLAAPLMPAGSVAHQYGVSPRRDLGADLHEMFVHGLRGGVGHDHGGPDGALGADRSEDVGGDMPVVANHPGAGADRRPDVGVAAFLTYASLILEPDFDRSPERGLGERGFG